MVDPFPTPEEEATLLCKEDEPSEVPGPTPRHLEIPRFVEPAEQTTTAATSAAPYLASESCSCPSWKGKKLWEWIGTDPNNSSQWVQAYLERDNRLPEWWKEFCPLVHSIDGHCNDAKVKSLAHQQAVAFCLPAIQKEVHGTWIAPSCLAALGRKEYLAPKDMRITWDFQEVQREEMVALAIVLQKCAIWARASPNKKGLHPLRSWPCCQECDHCHPQVFSGLR